MHRIPCSCPHGFCALSQATGGQTINHKISHYFGGQDNGIQPIILVRKSISAMHRLSLNRRRRLPRPGASATSRRCCADPNICAVPRSAPLFGGCDALTGVVSRSGCDAISRALPRRGSVPSLPDLIRQSMPKRGEAIQIIGTPGRIASSLSLRALTMERTVCATPTPLPQGRGKVRVRRFSGCHLSPRGK